MLQLQSTRRGRITLTNEGVAVKSWREPAVAPRRPNRVLPLWVGVFAALGESVE